MTETRDKGTGPTFLETSYQTLNKLNLKKNKLISKIENNSKKTSEIENCKKKKIRTDFWQ
tara:strand:+ start:350 stop:529 length:180 start_codon:yes stop_codon:yes gene_type:complete